MLRYSHHVTLISIIEGLKEGSIDAKNADRCAWGWGPESIRIVESVTLKKWPMPAIVVEHAALYDGWAVHKECVNIVEAWRLFALQGAELPTPEGPLTYDHIVKSCGRLRRTIHECPVTLHAIDADMPEESKDAFVKHIYNTKN